MIKLAENTQLGDFVVQRLIKEGLYNDCYSVRDAGNELRFMKFYDVEAMPEKMLEDDTVQEIIESRQISHPNIVSYFADGETVIDGRKYQYLVTQYLNGDLLSTPIRSGKTFTETEALAIIIPVLEGLGYLRDKRRAHNDITPRNILLSPDESGKIVPKIIDLGHILKPKLGAPPFPVEDLNVLYLAPEALKGFFTPDSDAFSAMAVLHAMLFGKAPWACEIDPDAPFPVKKAAVRNARKQELVIPEEGLSESTVTALKAGMLPAETRPDTRTLIDILTGKSSFSLDTGSRNGGLERPPKPENKKEAAEDNGPKVLRNESGKGGFADIAGMEKLKEELTKRVIWVLKDKDKAKKYRLTPPNGMLLYGPPGCGKTFFAQKFAEESGFNYFLVNGSDLGSVYVHGTQGKIADLFKDAAKKAPSVICFDEFDAFVPSRSSESATHRADEVNEFLSQLNNCSAKGIFVIGTTNRIDMIDPAVLRKGRLDLHFEIPAPDTETRKKMFELHLKDRPVGGDIDLDRLAELTDNYAASDIAFIVNEAAMVAALSDVEISARHLEDSIRCNPSSLGKKDTRRKIGFNQD
ncbi:MAG: AAA family ATPase [Bacteroidales bacterium]|nr:AAA family ATPase [Bacteroidales bacterium]